MFTYKLFNSSKDYCHKEVLNKNYLNPDTMPFLICNYSNKTYDSFLKYSRPYIPSFYYSFYYYILY